MKTLFLTQSFIHRRNRFLADQLWFMPRIREEEEEEEEEGSHIRCAGTSRLHFNGFVHFTRAA